MFDLNRLCAQLDLDPARSGLQIIGAPELAREFFPRLDSDRPALILDVADRQRARAVRRTLRVNYPAAHPVTIVNGDTTHAGTLGTLARAKHLGATTILYLPPLPAPSSPLSLAAIVARLRAPRGCPWDREQTHASLRGALLEEAYEVLEALDENDAAKLQEELGDLWLHVLMQTQIARDQNEFTLSDVGAAIAAKLIRRHPHVFGDVKVKNSAEVLQNWQRIKAEEKKGSAGTRDTRLDANVPRDLPALRRAQKVAARARRAGMGAADQTGVARLMRQSARGKKRARALGDLLFALAGWAETNHLDAESALREATARLAAPTDNVRRLKPVGKGTT